VAGFKYEFSGRSAIEQSTQETATELVVGVTTSRVGWLATDKTPSTRVGLCR
jgi:hypothetical protein